MDKLGVKSSASFIEDDCSSWVSDLLNHNEFAPLVVEYITPVFENMNVYLFGESYGQES
jgi:hypothetical protein